MCSGKLSSWLSYDSWRLRGCTRVPSPCCSLDFYITWKKMALLRTHKWPYLKVTRVPLLPRLQMKHISSEQPPTPTPTPNRHKCCPARGLTRSICYETLFGMRLPKCQGSGARNVNLDMHSALFRSSLLGTRLPNMSRVIIRWNASKPRQISTRITSTFGCSGRPPGRSEDGAVRAWMTPDWIELAIDMVAILVKDVCTLSY